MNEFLNLIFVLSVSYNIFTSVYYTDEVGFNNRVRQIGSGFLIGASYAFCVIIILICIVDGPETFQNSGKNDEQNIATKSKPL
mgnify:CR=1 FL=1